MRKKCPASVPSSTTAVEAISLKLSAAVAIMAAESIFLPSLRLKRYIQPLTKMETGRMMSGSREKSTGWGERIFWKEVLPSSKPMSRMTTETASPERYSTRPWPKG